MVPIADVGIKNALEKMDLAMLKSKALSNDNGEVTSYRVSLAIVNDRNSYVKSDGEVINEPNLGETFEVKIMNPKLAKFHQMVTGVKLIQPKVHALYATTSQDSSYAQLRISLTASDIQLPQASFKREGSK